jgi:hypothetical protein
MCVTHTGAAFSDHVGRPGRLVIGVTGERERLVWKGIGISCSGSRDARDVSPVGRCSSAEGFGE